MTESDQLIKDRYRILIYHGHIHVFSIQEEIENRNDINETQNPDL
ncbi:MAG: hypothetical protein ACFE9C_06170 [Candidatus Hodarchaeota archaeon]